MPHISHCESRTSSHSPLCVHSIRLVYQAELASWLFLQGRTLTHVQSPTYAFHTAIEPIRKVGVMTDIWMTDPPNIDKLWGGLGGIDNVLKRLCFI